MSFPSSPSDKEIYKQYRFNINIGAWRKYEYYGLHEETPGSSAKDILNKNPNANVDGVYWIKPQGYSVPEPFWCDMTTDGGGWTVVASHTMDTGSRYPTYQMGQNEFPSGDKNISTFGYKYIWPEYTEWSARSLYSEDYGDGTTTSRFWKFNTGSWGTVQANLLYAAYIDQNHTQDGRFTKAMANDFIDTHTHDSYNAYTWFGSTQTTYNHWGQTDLMGRFINSDIYATTSLKQTWISTYGCGASWSNTACREGKQAHIQRGNYIGKLNIMVR